MVHSSNSRLIKLSSPQAKRRARRADSRRLEILRAAARTFRRRGFAAAGMREIAAEADLSPGNLYHYFRGKDEILYFCQDRSLDVLLAALEDARASKRAVAERLERLLEAHVLCLLDELEGSSAHLEVEALPSRLRERIIAKRDEYERGIRTLVAAGVRRGELAPGDPSLLTRAMLGAANWTARWFRSDGQQTASQVAQSLAAYLVRGLAIEKEKRWTASPSKSLRPHAPERSDAGRRHSGTSRSSR